MNKAITWIVVAVLALGAGWYFWQQQGLKELEQVQTLPPQLEPQAEPPAIEHPVTDIELPPSAEPEPPQPLPALTDSDGELSAVAAELLGDDAVATLLISEQIINRLVATIDSLTSAKIAPLMLPWQPVPGAFTVLQSADQAAISPANAERYAPMVALVDKVDSTRLVALYRRYYPLFQESYVALGYPSGYFNDRLVAVIDHLLATPEPTGLMALVQVESVYLYADPELEALSAGQKLLLRLGPEHGAVVRGKLRQIRALVAKNQERDS